MDTWSTGLQLTYWLLLVSQTIVAPASRDPGRRKGELQVVMHHSGSPYRNDLMTCVSSIYTNATC